MYISNKSISEVGSCDLKTALDSIYLNYNFQPCAHSVLKDSSISFYVLRLLEVVCNSCLALFTIIVICLSHCRNENRYLFSIRKIRIIVIFVSSYIMFWNAVQYFQNEWCTNYFFFSFSVLELVHCHFLSQIAERIFVQWKRCQKKTQKLWVSYLW